MFNQFFKEVKIKNAELSLKTKRNSDLTNKGNSKNVKKKGIKLTHASEERKNSVLGVGNKQIDNFIVKLHNEIEKRNSAFNEAMDEQSSSPYDDNGQSKRLKIDFSHKNDVQLRSNRKASMMLSDLLRDLSNKKKLIEALRVYRDPKNMRVIDGHHGSIMIDCCSRCGHIQEAERVIYGMVKRDVSSVSVQALTALMKGYASSGNMNKGRDLYMMMLKMNGRKYLRPNVRTLNTCLRGCLWTASGRDSGGIITCEEIWSSNSHEGNIILDESSFEYSLILLTQALLPDDANQRYNQLEEFLKRTHQDNIGAQEAQHAVDKLFLYNETQVIACVALSRAHALLGNMLLSQSIAKKALKICASHHDSACVNYNFGEKNTYGGKRSWKQSDVKNTLNFNRNTSNRLFRNHRLLELKEEANCIINLCEFFYQQKGSWNDTAAVSRSELIQLMLTRLLYFGGGGTTNFKAKKKNAIKTNKNCSFDVNNDMINALWLSFGLASLVGIKLQPARNAIGNNMKSKKKHDRFDLGGRNFKLNETEFDALTSIVGKPKFDDMHPIVQSDGYIDFTRVFSTINNTKQQENKGGVEIPSKKKMYVELGSGFGDWVIAQANANPHIQYVAVELRSDRIAQTFARAVLNYYGPNCRPSSPLTNLCCCVSDCESFLAQRIRPQSISRIYVNHPEPPVQIINGAQDDFGASIVHDISEDEFTHMLNFDALNAIIECLKPNGHGEFIVVTDNRSYALLLCRLLVRVINHRRVQVCDETCKDEKEKKTEMSLKQMPLFKSPKSTQNLAPIETFPTYLGSIILYVGQPSEAIGHASAKESHIASDDNFSNGNDSSHAANKTGSSYFDRLWRSGAGRHAEMKDRFIIALQTTTAKLNSMVM